MNLRYGINRVHLWIGLILALPLVLISFSGSVLVYRWSLDAWINQDWYQASRSVRDQPKQVDWDHLVDTASRLTGDDEDVQLVWVSPASRGAVIAETTGHRWIHLDPYSGEVIGVRSETSWRSVVWVIQAFHTNFLLGEWGHTIVSIITLVSILSLLTGLVLWLLPLAKPWIARLGVRVGRSWPRINWDAHNAVGFYSVVTVSAIMITGVLIGFWPTVKPWVYQWTDSTPVGFKTSEVNPGNGPYSLTDSVEAARSTWPEARLKRILLTGQNKPVRMRFFTPGSPYEPGLSWIWVDPYTDTVLKTHHPDNRSTGDDFYLWLFPLHFGGWGLAWNTMVQSATRAVWCLSSLSVVFLSVSGLVIWLWKP